MSELSVNLVNTQAFINASPSDIALHRPTPAAVQSFDAPSDTVLAVQRVRIILPENPSISRDAPDTWTDFDVVVLGMPDLDVREHDWVDLLWGRLEIRYPMAPLPYERRARAVVRRRIE